MTLRTYSHDELPQGSDDWKAARRGMVTASSISRLITPTLKPADNEQSRRLIATLAAERITGQSDDIPMTRDMWRGVDSEPIARHEYDQTYAPVTQVGFMVHEQEEWFLGYSPDGLVGDDGLIEIKAPRATGHIQTVLEDAVPDGYMAQLQTGLFVTGRKWIDYVSYFGGLPLYVKRVLPDPSWRAVIAEVTDRAERLMTQIVADYDNATKGLPATERVPDPYEVELRLA